MLLSNLDIFPPQGIGREYALALARHGLNVILVSRNKQELENVANEIRDTYKVDTATIVADLSDADNIGKIVKKVKALNHEIGVLVNNVGMMGPGYNNMADMEKKAVKVKLSDSFFSNIRIVILPGNHHSERAAPDDVLSRLPPRHGQERQGRHHQHLLRGRPRARALSRRLLRHPALHLSSHSGNCSGIQRTRGRYPGSKKSVSQKTRIYLQSLSPR